MRRGLAQKQRGARRRVHLHAVMHFDDFHIVIGQRMGRLAHQRRKQIDAETHIPRFDDHRMTGGRSYPGHVVVRVSGRADHVHDARLGREFGKSDARGGRGEIEHGIASRKRGERVVRHDDSGRREPREEAGVLSCLFVARAFQREGEPQIGRFGEGADEGAAHAARGSGNCDADGAHAIRA